MKILYKNNTYETSCDLTIKKMLSDGGVILPTEEADKSSDILEDRPRRTRRRKKTEW